MCISFEYNFLFKWLIDSSVAVKEKISDFGLVGGLVGGSSVVVIVLLGLLALYLRTKNYHQKQFHKDDITTGTDNIKWYSCC